MSTPARDALADMLHDEWADTPSGWHVRGLDAAGAIDIYDIVRPLAVAISRNPDLVLAALIESGWRPTDDDLRAMGGTPVEMTNTDRPVDLGTCAYNQRGKPGADPNGSCSFGCYSEPECMTCRPRDGWPSDQGEPPEPWGYVAEPGALDHDDGGDLTVWQFVPKEATDGE